MNVLRHLAVQRVLSAWLLLSLGLWLATPAVAATPGVLTAQSVFGASAPATVEAALEQALGAAQSARTPEDFVAAFSEALAGQSDPTLAAFLGEHDGTEALLAVLYGHLIRAFDHHDGLEAMPSPRSAASAGTSSPPSFYTTTAVGPRASLATAGTVSGSDVRPHPLATLSSAQPLGP